MGQLRVVVIDDDHWRRSSMVTELNAHHAISVVGAMDQDEALEFAPELWHEVDVAVVDIIDEAAPHEVGSDMFSGIAALDHLRNLPTRTLAITPHRQHPLVELRLFQAEADWAYHRLELNNTGALVDALLHPSEARRPLPPDMRVLEELGAARSRPNAAVAAYVRSPLSGRLQRNIGQKGLGLSRRTVENFRSAVGSTGFRGSPRSRFGAATLKSPTWRDVRDYILTAIGRQGVPPTEVDRDG